MKRALASQEYRLGRDIDWRMHNTLHNPLFGLTAGEERKLSPEVKHRHRVAAAALDCIDDALRSQDSHVAERIERKADHDQHTAPGVPAHVLLSAGSQQSLINSLPL